LAGSFFPQGGGADGWEGLDGRGHWMDGGGRKRGVTGSRSGPVPARHVAARTERGGLASNKQGDSKQLNANQSVGTEYKPEHQSLSYRPLPGHSVS